MHRHIHPYIRTLNFAGCVWAADVLQLVEYLACIVSWLIFVLQVLTPCLATLSFLGIISINYSFQTHNTGVLHKWSDITYVSPSDLDSYAVRRNKFSGLIPAL